MLPVHLVAIHLPEWLSYSGLLIVGLGVILGSVALLQINTNLSPFPTPVAHCKLLTTGAFSIARHPIYTSILMVALGYALYQTSIFKFLITIALWVLFYFKSKYEEQLLLHKFSEYQTYKKKTRRFL